MDDPDPNTTPNKTADETKVPDQDAKVDDAMENIVKNDNENLNPEVKDETKPGVSNVIGNKDEDDNAQDDQASGSAVPPIQVKADGSDEAEEEADHDIVTESEEEVFRAELKPKKIIDPSFVYSLDTLVSKPVVTEDSGIPSNLVTLFHSFGFDAWRRQNIHLLDADTICFVDGNYLQILNITSMERTYVRTICGVGIGAFCVHPNKEVISVAEVGENPPVCIYRYPQLDLYRILEEGTANAYAACEFNTDGELLATVGSDPDYMLTLWEWRNEQIVLRCKAFSQEIFRVAWSNDLPGVLTTAGAGHIRIWRMADTFTGLKLQGKLGKFGKTELSDIEGFVILPDGKVLTGSHWGNLLVWEGDLIKVQISRKGRKPCHMGLIMHIVLDEGELMTLGQDGWIRTWDFEAVDTAECLEEGAIFELEPMNELQVDANAKLMYMTKVEAEDSTMWYAQDAGGAIWKLDLSFTHTSQAPHDMIRFHSGTITDCVTSPISYTAATIGVDGRICIYDIITKEHILRRKFPAGGTKLIWSPLKIDPKGKTLVAGFEDGVVRVLQFGENPETDPTRKAKHFALLDLGQALKPHVMSVTAMVYSPDGEYFATGSLDETVFFFSVYANSLKPIGFVHVGAPVAQIEWLPLEKTGKREVMVYLKEGCVIKLPCPTMADADHSKSFALPSIKPTAGFTLLSIKSRLQHEEESERKLQRYEEEKKARAELRAARAENEPETEEEAQRLDEEEELIRQGVMAEIADWAPTYPETPSPLAYAQLDSQNPNQFWLSLDDFDAGYLYKCELGAPPMSEIEARERIKQKKKEKAAMQKVIAQKTDSNEEDEVLPVSEASVNENVTEAASDTSDDESQQKPLTLSDLLIETEPKSALKFLKNEETTVTCWKFSSSGNRLFVGFKDGHIRVQVLRRPFDLTSMGAYWVYRVHDSRRGAVTKLALSHDEKFLLSAAQDGTFFAFTVMTEELQEKEIRDFRARIPSAYGEPRDVDDIVDPKAFSIEQAKQKMEFDRMMDLVEQKKAETRRKVNELRLRFKRLKEQNEKLPQRIRLGKEDFNLVPHIRDDFLRERNAKITMVYRETAWLSEKCRIALNKLEKKFRQPIDFDRILVRAFTTAHCVSSIRMNKLGDEHRNARLLINQLRDETLERQSRSVKPTLSHVGYSVVDSGQTIPKTTSDNSQQQMKGARGLRVAKKLHKLEEAQQRRNARRAQWDALRAMKPADDYDDPEDLKAIEEVKEKMGDFKLKSSENYIVGERTNVNAFEAKCHLVDMVEESYRMLSEFNNTVLKLRDKKLSIITELEKINDKLQELQEDLPENEPTYRFEIPVLDDEEFPERAFSYNKEILMNFKKENEERTDGGSTLSGAKYSLLLSSKQPAAASKQQRFTDAPTPGATALKDLNADVDPHSLAGGYPYAIPIPLHLLAKSECVVSMQKRFSPCMIQHFEAMTKADSSESAENKLEQVKCFRVIRTGGSVAPEKRSVAYEQRRSNTVSSSDTVKSDNAAEQQLQFPPLMAEEQQNSEMEPGSEVLQLPGVTESTPMNTGEMDQKRLRALFTRDELVKTASRLVRCFDAELRLARHARFQLDVLLKRAELHQLTLFEEYRLLKEFEKTEMVLTEKKNLKDDEKSQVNFKINEIQLKIENHRKELDRLAQKENQLHEEFKLSLGEGHRFADFLAKVFKKRIKRKRQESREGDSNESDESSSSSDESTFDEEEEETDDEEAILDLDTCPTGCPLEDYENTCAIRERRLDLEESITEEKKALDILKKDLEAWTKKQRIVQAAHKQAQTELEAFQLEKQRNLNELDTIVILRLNQIQYYVNCTIPSDLRSGLVFERANLRALLNRIRVLQEESKTQLVEQKDAKERHIMLQKHKKLFRQELENISAKCDTEMIDKFGKLDDLERMEGVVVNPKIEELTTKMLVLQDQFETEERELEEKIRSARDACIDELRENTKTLNKTLTLLDEKDHLEKQLNKKQKTELGFGDDSQVQDLHELKRLKQLVKAQDQEIIQLRMEAAQAYRNALANSKCNSRKTKRNATNSWCK